MRTVLVAVAIVLAAIDVTARATDLTGEALALACASNVPNLKRERNAERYAQFCNMYINGWDDARVAFLHGTRTFCPPGITVKEMSVVFFDYLASHNEARKLPAAQALMLAFKDKFPCQDQSVVSSRELSSSSRVRMDELPSEVATTAKELAATCREADSDATGGDLEKAIDVYEGPDGRRLAIFQPSRICSFKGNGVCSTDGCDIYAYSQQSTGAWKKELQQSVGEFTVQKGRGSTSLQFLVTVRGNVPPCTAHRSSECTFEVTWRGGGFSWTRIR